MFCIRLFKDWNVSILYLLYDMNDINMLLVNKNIWSPIHLHYYLQIIIPGPLMITLGLLEKSHHLMPKLRIINYFMARCPLSTTSQGDGWILTSNGNKYSPLPFFCHTHTVHMKTRTPAGHSTLSKYTLHSFVFDILTLNGDIQFSYLWNGCGSHQLFSGGAKQ